MVPSDETFVSSPVGTPKPSSGVVDGPLDRFNTSRTSGPYLGFDPHHCLGVPALQTPLWTCTHVHRLFLVLRCKKKVVEEGGVFFTLFWCLFGSSSRPYPEDTFCAGQDRSSVKVWFTEI